ncbi:MAG TPA: SDR family NAD(P)-dependent oxidoreductase [Dehalococcoidia bacterium]|nr:SDR family NAD(P)-dependent oxidoreductase [Dehalococcoidia bacterium]
MRDFRDKVAVVTGGASGIGKAMAERFAQEGMAVVLADFEREALNAAAAEFRQREQRVLPVWTDVSNEDSVQGLADEVRREFGAVHILCNNAGVVAESDLGMQNPRRVWELSMKDWHWTFAVNFWGVVHGIRAFVPDMVARNQDAHIVNTASIAGLTSGAALPIYGASKHAVVRLSEGLYHQLRQMESKVKVSVLCPGGVRTRITSAARNRPEAFREGAEAPSPEWAARSDEMWSQRAATMEPSEVADKVWRAIQDERFYILTHPGSEEGVRRRLEAILADAAPTREY